jgi:hypothetical protein
MMGAQEFQSAHMTRYLDHLGRLYSQDLDSCLREQKHCRWLKKLECLASCLHVPMTYDPYDHTCTLESDSVFTSLLLQNTIFINDMGSSDR